MPKPFVIAVLNHKGGIAKTTTACNLATCWAANDKRVLLVDLDAQGNAGASFGLVRLAERGVWDVMCGRLPLADAITASPYPRLMLLPATQEMRTADLSLAREDRGLDLLRPHLESYDADVIVLDCPPAFGIIALNALAAAHAVIIPSRPDPFSHEGLVSTWQEVAKMRQIPGIGLKHIAILLTITHEGIAPTHWIETARKEFDHRVCLTVIPSDEDVMVAAQRSIPVTVLSPDGVAGTAYRHVAQEIAKRFQLEESAPDDVVDVNDRAILNTLREWRGGNRDLSTTSRHHHGWIDEGEGVQEQDTEDDLPDAVPKRPVPLWIKVAIASTLALSGLLGGWAVTILKTPH